ncbi:hypothetical protein GCM10022419_108390 [Nonomuraea rosea]|uniref:YdhG-like domain-containing protein n=1 Tax=Nonomuraea rosea TaxID=638574 RepID=A0ABP6ZEC3_9ACTN
MAKFTTVDEYLAAQPEPLRAIAEKLLPIIDAVLPGAGALWQGHPVWSLGAAPGKNPVCLIKAYTSYVTFGFWKGRELVDDSGRMDTTGGMAHIKIRTAADIDAELFTAWLMQARDLERSAPQHR